METTNNHGKKSNKSTLTNLEWLLQGDPVIGHLTKKYLLDEPSSSNNKGYIERYLSMIDSKTLKWGKGYYGPKWISTNYTLLDLVNMKIMPDTEVYHQSLLHYLDYYWNDYLGKTSIQQMDLCITGMFIRLLSYGRISDKRLDQLVNLALEKRMPDGGWNCTWFRRPYPKISSVHTTINVLEGLAEYLKLDNCPRRAEVKLALRQGIQVLLDRQLIFQKNTQIPIHPSMAEHHYPPRWKYDYLRVLEFLAKQKVPECEEMQPVLALLESKMKQGKLTKGTAISGLIHFPLETGTYGRFNTLRAYLVLKFYRPALYECYLTQDY